MRRSGKSYAHPLAVVIVDEGEAENSRIGIVCSKTIGSAVHRNLVKRQLREIAGDLVTKSSKAADILIIAREPSRTADFYDLQKVILEIFCRANLINSNDHDE